MINNKIKNNLEAKFGIKAQLNFKKISVKKFF